MEIKEMVRDKSYSRGFNKSMSHFLVLTHKSTFFLSLYKYTFRRFLGYFIFKKKLKKKFKKYVSNQS